MDKLQERASRLEKEIAEKLDDEQWENWQVVLKYINELQQEKEKYKYLYQKVLDNTIKADRENLKKGQIINLMAEELTTMLDATEEEIKECFRKKVE